MDRHADVPDHSTDRVAKVMVSSPWHTCQVITKRSIRLRDLLQKQLTGRILDNRTWDARPCFPAATQPPLAQRREILAPTLSRWSPVIP